MRPSSVLLLAASFSTALADVLFLEPEGGVIFEAGKPFNVSWIDSGDVPSIVDLTTYNVRLYSGSNSEPKLLLPLAEGSFSSGNSVMVTVPDDAGGSSANAYFLAIVSSTTDGEPITTYSDRFTMSGMTGSFDGETSRGLDRVYGTIGPQKLNRFVDPMLLARRLQERVAATTAGAQYDVTMTLQTGSTRYAPMLQIPPKTITKTNTVAQYPTSSVSIATTWLTYPTIVNTVTLAQTATFASHANTAADAPLPSDDMAKFLARWKD